MCGVKVPGLWCVWVVYVLVWWMWRGVWVVVWGVEVVCVWLWWGWGFVISVFGWPCGVVLCGGFLVWGVFSHDVCGLWDFGWEGLLWGIFP